MSQEDIKNKTNEQNEQTVEESGVKENEGCTGDCSCNLFSYKRPTEDDAKKTKRKTCC